MARYKKYIEIVIQQLNKFKPESDSVDQILEETSAILQTRSVPDEKFILQVLCGCLEYKPLLDVVVNAFFARVGKHCLVSDHNLYLVVCCLSTFHLEELGLQHFSKIIKSLDPAKMHKFLRFFFDVGNLNTWIKDEWSQIYDFMFVKQHWIDPLLKWQPKVQQLINYLDDVLANRHMSPKTSKVTKPKEFNLTVPRPRGLPVPQPIPQQEKPRPVPPSTYKRPKEMQLLEEKKFKNRREAEERLLRANTEQFQNTALKPKDRDGSVASSRIKTSVMEKKRKACKPVFSTRKASEEPVPKPDNPPIRLNAASILREGALYQRKAQEELRRVNELAQGSGDFSEFLEWQKQMRGKDLEQELAEQEYRKLRGKLSYEEAILAHQNQIQENKKKADRKKEETAVMMRRWAERRLQEEKEMRELVEQVMEGHKNTRQAQTKLQKCKRQIVEEVAEESRKLLCQGREQAQEDLNRRFQLIHQIRALESLPAMRNKCVDLTQTPGYGFHGEMSIVELRERLILLREAQKRIEEDKRDHIIQEKLAKEQLLLDKLEQICLAREVAGRTAALKHEEKKVKPWVAKASRPDERLLDLQRKIAEKSLERKKQTKAQKVAKPTGESTVLRRCSEKHQRCPEERHWREIQENRQRLLRTLQGHPPSPERAAKRAAGLAAMA
ncbi:cilia- and flagella-associated protein 99 [Tachyglossus aculeatus]|uniref:cilia- and flagella-associated protein 99 n=1 Tax=Tachyglossus aculeatus TaxID=9261 RepID=UPI0018F6A1EE|nr:cilia- and flagella-associated protein 99 [Tachyglossus aculeatus]